MRKKKWLVALKKVWMMLCKFRAVKSHFLSEIFEFSIFAQASENCAKWKYFNSNLRPIQQHAVIKGFGCQDWEFCECLDIQLEQSDNDDPSNKKLVRACKI